MSDIRRILKRRRRKYIQLGLIFLGHNDGVMRTAVWLRSSDIVKGKSLMNISNRG